MPRIDIENKSMQQAKLKTLTLRSRQAGMGALGWLIVLAIAAFALTSFFRVGPIYLEYWNVRNSLDNILADDKAAGKTRAELLTSISKHFEVSQVDVVNTKDIKFTQTKEGLVLDASYEKRVPLIANIDVVVKFDKLKYILSAPQ